MIKTERINVNITRIVSPTEFWLRLQTDKCNNEPYPFVAGTADEQEAHGDNLRWIKGIETLFIHLHLHVFI